MSKDIEPTSGGTAKMESGSSITVYAEPGELVDPFEGADSSPITPPNVGECETQGIELMEIGPASQKTDIGQGASDIAHTAPPPTEPETVSAAAQEAEDPDWGADTSAAREGDGHDVLMSSGNQAQKSLKVKSWSQKQ